MNVDIQNQMSKLLAEIASEREMAQKLDEKKAHTFADFHWSIVKRDRAKLDELIEQARREAQLKKKQSKKKRRSNEHTTTKSIS